jgi:hypothetical protein
MSGRVKAFVRALRRRRRHWAVWLLLTVSALIAKALFEGYVQHRYGSAFAAWVDAHVPSASAAVLWALHYWWVPIVLFGLWLFVSAIRASRTPTTFAYLRLCWHIGEPFWHAYTTRDHPADNELDEYIIGPMCPHCGWSLKREIETREGLRVYLQPQCLGCSRMFTDPPVSLYGLAYYQNKRLAYNEAQALVRTGRAIPPCQQIKKVSSR